MVLLDGYSFTPILEWVFYKGDHGQLVCLNSWVFESIWLSVALFLCLHLRSVRATLGSLL